MAKIIQMSFSSKLYLFLAVLVINTGVDCYEVTINTNSYSFNSCRQLLEIQLNGIVPDGCKKSIFVKDGLYKKSKGDYSVSYIINNDFYFESDTIHFYEILPCNELTSISTTTSDVKIETNNQGGTKFFLEQFHYNVNSNNKQFKLKFYGLEKPPKYVVFPFKKKRGLHEEIHTIIILLE